MTLNQYLAPITLKYETVANPIMAEREAPAVGAGDGQQIVGRLIS